MVVAKTKQATAEDQRQTAQESATEAAQFPAIASAAVPATIDVSLPRELALPVTTFANLATGISEITGKIAASPVHKGGRNTFHNYDYARMQDILAKLTPMMADAGITILQSEVTRGFMDSGSAVYVEYEFTIIHKSGEVWPQKLHQTGVCNARASNGKFDDKAINKCHTAARKYMLLSLFQIPTTDDEDADLGANDDRQPERRDPPTSERRAEAKPPAAKPERPPVAWAEPFVIPTEGKKFPEWAAEYSDHIKIAKDAAELAGWSEKNSKPLNMLANDEKAARLYARIVEIQNARLEELAARE